MTIGETLVKLLGIQPWEKVLVLTDLKKEKIGRKIFKELKAEMEKNQPKEQES
jgi:hypothetical protein